MTYVYVLRLNPRLHSEAAWTDGDRAIVSKQLQSDPAVVAGVMTATLHAYSIALQRE